jgi:WD40 repeat protein
MSEGLKGMQWEYNKTNFERNLAVVIGIDRYKSDSIHDLSTPVSDARALADLLETEYEYKPQNVIRLFDEAATLTGLQTLLTDTLPHQLKPTKYDRLIFYFAGHGIPRNSQDGPKGYLVPQDADWHKEDSFLPMSKVYEALSQLECHHLLVILDCCFAGTFRWAGRRKMIPILETVRREHYDRFIRYPAWQVITSAAHDQEALDVAKLAEDKRGAVADEKQELHSPFALALLEGLRENKADVIPDGVITAHELYLYLDQQVSQLSGSRQKPGIYPMRLEHDRGEFVFTRPGFKSDQLKPAPLLNESNNPYRGLASFDEKHANFFFGRKILVEELQRRLSQSNHSLTVVLGASGSGKSSLVKAGLIPDLRQESKWYILDPMRPDRSPFTALARAILPIEKPELIEQVDQVSFLDEVFKPKDESGQDKGDEPTDAAFVKLAESWSSATPEAKLLVVEDYFEQLLALCRNPQEKEQLSQLYRAIFENLESLSNRLQNEPQHLPRVIRKWSESHPDAKLLLTIDQFEELITMSQESQIETHGTDRQESDSPNETVGERAAEPQPWLPFLQVLLEAIVECQKQLHIVLTLRSDFEPRFLSSPLSAYWKDARFPVRAMNLDELRQAIEGPALKQALYFEPPELVGMLIDEVGQMPGALPLLSFTLSELYIKLHERWTKDNATDRALRIKDYEELGGVAGALTRRATEEYDNLVRDFGEQLGKAYQATMQRVMLRMVTLEGGGVARRRVPIAELVYPDSEENKRVAQVSDHLVKARLLVKGQETGEPYVEPAHDFLVRGWDKLQRWIKEEQEDLALQQRLTPAANDWSRGRGALWTREEARLARLQEMLDATDKSWLNRVEKKFVEESVEQRRLELEEAERQRDDAIQGQVNALTSLSEARLVADQQLESLVAAVQAGSIVFNNEKLRQRFNILNSVVLALFKAIDSVAEYNRFQGHIGAVSSIVFSPNDKLIATGGEDGTIRLWERNGQELKTIRCYQHRITNLSFSYVDEVIVTAGEDNVVKLLNFNGKELKRFYITEGLITAISCSPDGQTIVASVEGNVVKLWNLDGQCLGNLIGHKDNIYRVVFSPTAQIVATASNDETVRFWTLHGEELATIEGQNWIFNISFNTNDQTVAIADGADKITLWRLDGQLVNTFEGFTYESNCVGGEGSFGGKVAFNSGCKIVATACQSGVIKLWKLEKQLLYFDSGTKINDIKADNSTISSICFSQDGQTIASGRIDGIVKLWKVQRQLPGIIEDNNSSFTSISFSHDSKKIVTGSEDGVITLWNKEGKKLKQHQAQQGAIKGVGFKANNQDIVFVSQDGTVMTWNSETGEVNVAQLNQDKVNRIRLTAGSNALVWSNNRDSDALVWGSNDGVVKLHNLATGEIKTYQEPKGVISSVNFSPDSQTIVYSVNFNLDDEQSVTYYGENGVVKLWNPETGEVKTLQEHTGAITKVVFSPDGQLIASGGRDHAIRLWNLNTQKVKTLKKNLNWTTDLSFSPDSQILASSEGNEMEGYHVKLFNLSGQELATLSSFGTTVYSPDGQILASQFSSNKIVLWNFHLADLLKYGRNWISDYIKTNPENKDKRYLCEDNEGFIKE